MAKQNKNQPVKYVGFVRYTVDKAIKEAVKADTRPSALILDLLCKEVDNGYKLSIDYNDESETYQVSLYGSSYSCDNAGVGLSGRHSELTVAMKVLLHVHTNVFAAGWPDSENLNGDQYSW